MGWRVKAATAVRAARARIQQVQVHGGGLVQEDSDKYDARMNSLEAWEDQFEQLIEALEWAEALAGALSRVPPEYPP